MIVKVLRLLAALAAALALFTSLFPALCSRTLTADIELKSAYQELSAYVKTCAGEEVRLRVDDREMFASSNVSRCLRELTLSHYLLLWNEELPIAFVYAQRAYLVPHLLLPSGREIVLTNLTLNPWGGGCVSGTLTGPGTAYKVKAVPIDGDLQLWNVSECPLDPLNRLSLASPADLARYLNYVINEHKRFGLVMYMVSTATLLSEEPDTFTLEYPVAQLSFNCEGSTCLVNATLLGKPPSVRAKAVYDAERVGLCASVLTLLQPLRMASAVLLALVGVAALLRALGPKPALAAVGALLLLLSFHETFEAEGYVYVAAFTYAEGGSRTLPLEVILHARQFEAMGARVDSPLPRNFRVVYVRCYRLNHLPGGPYTLGVVRIDLALRNGSSVQRWPMWKPLMDRVDVCYQPLELQLVPSADGKLESWATVSLEYMGKVEVVKLKLFELEYSGGALSGFYSPAAFKAVPLKVAITRENRLAEGAARVTGVATIACVAAYELLKVLRRSLRALRRLRPAHSSSPAQPA